MLDVKNSKFGKFDGAAVARFLRQAFPTGTAQNVSTMTGIPTSTVDKWLRGDAAHFECASWDFGGCVRAGLSRGGFSRGAAMAGTGAAA